jgi:hypothetical protein
MVGGKETYHVKYIDLSKENKMPELEKFSQTDIEMEGTRTATSRCMQKINALIDLYDPIDAKLDTIIDDLREINTMLGDMLGDDPAPDGPEADETPLERTMCDKEHCNLDKGHEGLCMTAAILSSERPLSVPVDDGPEDPTPLDPTPPAEPMEDSTDAV